VPPSPPSLPPSLLPFTGRLATSLLSGLSSGSGSGFSNSSSTVASSVVPPTLFWKAAPYEVTVLFPLVSEDPLVDQRQFCNLGDVSLSFLPSLPPSISSSFYFLGSFLPEPGARGWEGKITQLLRFPDFYLSYYITLCLCSVLLLSYHLPSLPPSLPPYLPTYLSSRTLRPFLTSALLGRGRRRRTATSLTAFVVGVGQEA